MPCWIWVVTVCGTNWSQWSVSHKCSTKDKLQRPVSRFLRFDSMATFVYDKYMLFYFILFFPFSNSKMLLNHLFECSCLIYELCCRAKCMSWWLNSALLHCMQVWYVLVVAPTWDCAHWHEWLSFVAQDYLGLVGLMICSSLSINSGWRHELFIS